MIKFFKKNRKTLYLALAFAAVGLIVPVHFAGANVFTDITTSVVNKFAAGLVNIIYLMVTKWLLPLFAGIVNWVFAQIGTAGYTRAQVVQDGWAISRDLANMFFILALLVIGFATILRVDSYQMRRLLPKLIFIALIVNFSLLVGGIFIDIGNDLGMFFITGGSDNVDTQTGINLATGEEIKVGDSLIEFTKLTRAIDGSEGTQEALENQGALVPIVRAIGSLIFVLVLAFLMGAMAIIMIFRLVALWILLIVAPFAWVAYILPNTSKFGSQWWENFLKWAFFPAVFGFFLYLAFLTGSTFEQISWANTPEHVEGFQEQGTVPFNSLAAMLQYIVVVTIAFMGLVWSQKWAGGGAKAAMGFANSAKDYALGKVKGVTFGAAKLPLRGAAAGATAGGRAVARGVVPQVRRQQFREWLERKPGIGRAVGGPGAAYKEQQEALKNYRKEFKDDRTKDLELKLNQTVVSVDGEIRRAAVFAELAKKGGLKEEHKKYLRSFLNSGGRVDEVLANNPSWFFDEEVQEILASHSATQKDWSNVANEESGSEKRYDEAAKLLKDKLPKKPTDFANIQKSNVNYNEKDISYEEKRARESVAQAIFELMQDGEITAKHINAAANKNPALNSILLKHLEEVKKDRPGDWSKLPPSFVKAIENMPGSAALAPEESQKDE